jgi:WD40 repeat protein
VTRDGKRLAFVVHRGGQRRLWVMNADGSDPRPISGDLEVHGAPAWSPDGRWVAAGVYRGNEVHLYKFPADGGPAIPLISSKSGTDRVYATDPAWSPSGDFLVYTGPDVGTNFDLFAVNADGTPHTVPKLTLTRGSRRLAFREEHELVFMDGNISYRGRVAPQGRYRLGSHDGDITLEVPELNAMVSVSTFEGEFTSCGYPATVTRGDRDDRPRTKRFRFTVGDGGGRVDLESFDGNIYLVKTGCR